MSAPVVGVTTYGRDEEGSFVLPGNYLDALRRAGGVPVLVAPGESRWQDIFPRVDGWVLVGGGDLAPSHYGGREHESVYMVDDERDTSELELVRHIVDSQVPTLAICRGMQLVNVVLGGTLHEHLPDIVGEAVLHRAPPREPISHMVTVDPSSALAAIVGASEFEVASWHHQAIRALAAPLRVVARAPDDVIEAIEMPEHNWLIGVQWHPEITAATHPPQQRLFDALVQKLKA